MNKALRRLFGITEKPECRIIGLMSGTSLDGLDVVLCRISENEIIQEKFETVGYPADIYELLKKTRSKEIVSLAEVSYLNTVLALFTASSINTLLLDWGIKNDEIDLIASHGQTMYHAPDSSPKNTLQIVDGDHIAQKTGIITFSDFRQKHVAAGGEGAPLAIYLDKFLFKDENRTRVALNLGGIANLTVIPSGKIQQKLISTDVGPANTLINEAMQKYFKEEFDNEGKTAAKGESHSGLVKYLLLDPFFRKPFPKSTGQELFNLDWVERMMESHSIELPPEDLVASLTELTVKCIARALDRLAGDAPYDLIVSGGGQQNHTMINSLQQDLLHASWFPITNFGITSDAKEAVLMAYLAFNNLKNIGVNIDGTNMHLGKISLPD